MRKKQPPHICKYQKSIKILDTQIPPNSRFGKIRRKLRESLLVSETNGRKCYTPQGTAGYLFEKEKQLTQYYYMIHPYSKFREIWEIFVIIEILLCLTVRFFVVSQFWDGGICLPQYQIPSLFVDLFEMSDVGLRFLTGIIVKETRVVTLEIRKIFTQTVKDFCFYMGFVISFPLEFFVYISTIGGCPNHVLMYWVFIKILKVVTLTRYLFHISRIYNWPELIFRMVWTLIMMFLLVHWLSSLFFLIVVDKSFQETFNISSEPGDYFYKHFTIFYMISSIFFFQNGLLPHLRMNSTTDFLFCSTVLIITNLSNVIFIGIFVELLGLTKTPLTQYEEMIQEVQKFLIQENLPRHIHRRVVKYFQFRFQYRYFREKIILDTLSPPLRQEIANYLCMDLIINRRSIFYQVPFELASALCLRLRFEIFLPGDIITKAGKKASQLYFIYCGTAARYSAKGKEFSHLYPGEQFGVSAFSADNRYLTTVIALEISECYALRYRDFLQCTEDYPYYRNLVMKAAERERIFLYRSQSDLQHSPYSF